MYVTPVYACGCVGVKATGSKQSQSKVGEDSELKQGLPLNDCSAPILVRAPLHAKESGIRVLPSLDYTLPTQVLPPTEQCQPAPN